MKTLPKYYVIKQDRSDPRWKRYIEWLNSTYDQFWKGSEYLYYGFDGSLMFRGANCFHNIIDFQNSPTLITLDDWEEATQGKQKPKRHTYTTTHTREDGISFQSDSIDGKNISGLEAEEKEHYAKARAIRALLNAHKNLKF